MLCNPFDELYLAGIALLGFLGSGVAGVDKSSSDADVRNRHANNSNCSLTIIMLHTL